MSADGGDSDGEVEVRRERGRKRTGEEARGGPLPDPPLYGRERGEGAIGAERSEKEQ